MSAIENLVKTHLSQRATPLADKVVELLLADEKLKSELRRQLSGRPGLVGEELEARVELEFLKIKGLSAAKPKPSRNSPRLKLPMNRDSDSFYTGKPAPKKNSQKLS